MNKFSKKTFNLLTGALILVLVLLAGCTQGTPTTFCHATGDLTSPYEEIAVSSRAVIEEHIDHPNDILPIPGGGCPTSSVEIVDGEITICHATRNETNPYNEIKVSVNGLNGHGGHQGDIFPMPEGGCPTSLLDNFDGKISICHATGDDTTPYNEVLVSVNGLNGHDKHEGDIFPVPESGCPTSPLVIVDREITICHATGDETTPFEEVSVSINGLNGHGEHEGDIFPVPDSGCPSSALEIVDGKIAICHATGSEKNPYVETTVSVNGLNGHGMHEGDIIPVPGGGCPVTKQ